MELGYAISCEEHPPLDIVRHARRAEEAGFPFALISDHFHAWIDRQDMLEEGVEREQAVGA